MNRRYLLFFSILFFLSSCTSRQENSVVAIQPFEGMSMSLCDSVKRTIEIHYGFRVYILPYRKLPDNAFVNIKSPRYRADSLLNFLRKHKPDSVDYVLGLTSKDISVPRYNEDGTIKEPVSRYKDFGIFGLGFRPGSSCIVSTFRLNDRHAKFFERLKKVALHELGHNLGLQHCTNAQCFMRNAAEKIQTIDQVSLFLCDPCTRKIR